MFSFDPFHMTVLYFILYSINECVKMRKPKSKSVHNYEMNG